MAASAVDPEQLAAMVDGSLKFKGGPQVGILTGIAQHPKKQHHAGCSCKNNQGGDQSTTTVALGVIVLTCSS